MSEKWMPPKPDFQSGITHSCNRVTDYYISYTAFTQWYDTHIKPLFENAVEVYGNEVAGWIKPEHEPGPLKSHRALLIKVQPIKEDTAEDLLRELVERARNTGVMPDPIWLRAKAFLERK